MNRERMNWMNFMGGLCGLLVRMSMVFFDKIGNFCFQFAENRTARFFVFGASDQLTSKKSVVQSRFGIVSPIFMITFDLRGSNPLVAKLLHKPTDIVGHVNVVLSLLVFGQRITKLGPEIIGQIVDDFQNVAHGWMMVDGG